MKQTPETLDTIIAFLAEARDIRTQERALFDCPAQEQEAARQSLKDKVAAVYDLYTTKLVGTPEKKYLDNLAVRYDLRINPTMTIDEFSRKYRLSTRAANVLTGLETEGIRIYRTGKYIDVRIKIPRDLQKYSANDFMGLTGVGLKTFLELADALEKEGYPITGTERYRIEYQKKIARMISS